MLRSPTLNPLDEWLGIGAGMRAALERIPDVAEDAQPLLLVGESGTGRGSLAKAVHHNSARAAQRFTALAIDALPESLVDAELLGAPNCPFGRRYCRPGRFQLASKGTLYLGHVHALETSLQWLLLTWLRAGEIEVRVRGALERRAIDARLITSTCPVAFRDGTFDALIPDLLCRLGSAALYLPALRDRRQDIPELAAFFADWADRFKCRIIGGIDDDVVQLLSDYTWPDNVRQLESVVTLLVERAAGSTIRIQDLRRLAFTRPLEPAVAQRLNTWATQPFDWLATRPDESLVAPQLGASGPLAEPFEDYLRRHL